MMIHPSIADLLPSIFPQPSQPNSVNDMPQSLLHDWLDVVIANEQQCSDARFTSGTFLVDQMEANVTMIVNLYPGGFSIDNQRVFYTYDSPYRQLLRAIDSCTLTAEVKEMLSDMTCHYYDGNILVDVHDYRYNSSPTQTPIIRRVMLKPDMSALAADIDECCKEYVDETNSDFQTALELERRILLATERVNLNPSQSVSKLANVMQYNALKFNMIRKPKKKKLSLSSTVRRKQAQIHKEITNRVTYDYVTNKTGFGLLSFLREQAILGHRPTVRVNSTVVAGASAPDTMSSSSSSSQRPAIIQLATDNSNLQSMMTPMPASLAATSARHNFQTTNGQQDDHTGSDGRRRRKLNFSGNTSSSSSSSSSRSESQDDDMDLEGSSSNWSSPSSGTSHLHRFNNVGPKLDLKPIAISSKTVIEALAVEPSISIDSKPSNWEVLRTLKFEAKTKRGHQICEMDIYYGLQPTMNYDALHPNKNYAGNDSETLAFIRVKQVSGRNDTGVTDGTTEAIQSATSAEKASLEVAASFQVPSDVMCFSLGSLPRHRPLVNQFIDLFSREGFVLVKDSSNQLPVAKPSRSSRRGSRSSSSRRKKHPPSISATQMLHLQPFVTSQY
eukprot:TRINITY_DN2709_c0_g1_i3.p1 TRINITY_DN2709_c0_g1~~TRINITY_DN2709_c0_g1_i3.p1  ORF type:complete len:614 (-),score=208.08 TRINITY_DN2709_c0_g1_i3:20-1861(-)